MACSKLEARGHLLHKTGTPPKHFSRECNVRTRIMNISLYISFLLFISDVHKKHVMNVWRHLKATNLFPLMTVMANAKTAIFVTQI